MELVVGPIPKEPSAPQRERLRQRRLPAVGPDLERPL